MYKFNIIGLAIVVNNDDFILTEYLKEDKHDITYLNKIWEDQNFSLLSLYKWFKL